MNEISLKDNSIVFVLGAGSSIDAGIPTAYKMVSDFEKDLENDSELRKLYMYLKSSIIFQRGLKSFQASSSVSIEEVLNVIEALKLQEDNILYPYIGTWSHQLIKTSGIDFQNIHELDTRIRKLLFEWVTLSDYRKGNYFSGIGRLANQLNTSLRIFSLNYDICVERAFNNNDLKIETGISQDTYEWSSLRFDDQPDEQSPHAYLYKVHGSIDWKKQENGLPTYSETPIREDPQVIFGTAVKLRSLDPYLFNLYEFRKFLLHDSLKFIVVIGYSFSDDHINRLLQQSMQQRIYTKIIIVAPYDQDSDHELAIINKLMMNSCNIDRFVFLNETAKEFLDNLSSDFFIDKYPQDPDMPF